MTTKIHPLTIEAFAPFGDVIEARDSAKSFIINHGFSERFHDLANFDAGTADGHLGLSIFRTQNLPIPISICMLERHPLGTQGFMPLSGRPYLVVVAPPGDLDESKICVFRAEADQGINYRKGTWHHFCIPIGQPSDFLVLDRMGPGDNCEEVMLKQPIYIEAQDLPPKDLVNATPQVPQS